MTKSKQDEDKMNRASLKFYSDVEHITTITTLNTDNTIQGGNTKLKYNKVLNPKHTDIIEIKTNFDKDDYSKEFNICLMYNTIIEKRFYKNAKHMRKIMHPFSNRTIQQIPEIRVSDVPNSNVCFKVKDACDGGQAVWFVVAPVVNKELTQDILEQVKRVAE